MYHVNKSVRSTVGNVTAIRSGKAINVGVNVKIQHHIMHEKRLYLESF